MASEITGEDDEHPFPIQRREVDETRIRQIIDYQKSLYLSSSSSSFSSAAASTSSFSSPRSRSSLLDLMKDGSTSLRRLFDMEHTSLGNYFKDYSVSPIVKPVLLWGSDSDNDAHDDPWADIKQIGGALRPRIGGLDRVLSAHGSFNDDQDIVQHGKREQTRRRKLIRTKTYKRLPRFSLWRCGGFRFRLRLIRKLRVMNLGRKL
ncbi:UNVERIFIED_CONTAM: hypothetical protein Slati_2800700 [Sesamum latifolium]|uniref:Uncharacterized protein n=1 Tax=Sesamum latifolium TaxID=2727402 RepID=A0AAW2V9X2_9LAMI